MAKEERLVEAETENAVLHLRLAQYREMIEKSGGEAAQVRVQCGDQKPLQRPGPLAASRLRLVAQRLKRDVEALHSWSLGLFQRYQHAQRDCLSEIVTAVQRAPLCHEALPPAGPLEAGCLERSLQEMTERYQQERRERRRLHNTLVELRGNIRVHCRLRPVLPFDDEFRGPGSQNSCSGCTSGVELGSSRDTTDSALLGAVQPLTSAPLCLEQWPMPWMIVYGPAESQRAVFEDVCPLLTSFLDGYNVCIMAYGQTGSGKSFTMLGPRPERDLALPSGPHGHLGIIPRAAGEVFRLIAENPSWRLEVDVSVVEVYNNDIFDLLAKDGCAVVSRAKRQVLTTTEGKKEVSGLTRESVHSAVELMTLVAAALRLRAKQATAVHADSSRSHLVITVTLTAAASSRSTADRQSDQSPPAELRGPTPQRPAPGRRPGATRTVSSVSPRTRGLGQGSQGPGGQVLSKLQLVDLAGSECAGVSGVTGSALRETSLINRSLAALADVLGALSEGRGHIPYRNSTLTHFLQDALGGDAKLQVIVCVSPCQKHVAETLQSLGFGARARQVERGCPAPRKPRSEWTLRHWDVKALISKNTMKSWILAEILCVAKRAGPQSTPRTASTSGDKVVQAQGTSVAAVPQAGCSAPHRAPTSLECLLGVHNWRGDSYSAWEATGLLQFPASPRMPPRTHRPALGRGEDLPRRHCLLPWTPPQDSRWSLVPQTRSL
ncbi:kinesin-like protein KIF25 isoform X2 [Camelus ferus]|uniref:Kinesin-like protein n=1 Tax=Camelus ferus TaxID=419612 RepID=A0A8B8TGD6_CAMFR|nr:kinesin-like protein KIF25 isoform X2 [Camelus ferus]